MDHFPSWNCMKLPRRIDLRRHTQHQTRFEIIPKKCTKSKRNYNPILFPHFQGRSWTAKRCSFSSAWETNGPTIESIPWLNSSEFNSPLGELPPKNGTFASYAGESCEPRNLLGGFTPTWFLSILSIPGMRISHWKIGFRMGWNHQPDGILAYLSIQTCGRNLSTYIFFWNSWWGKHGYTDR